jgi:LmbE family N-acetylglucosaminyl deacetylase
MSVYPGVPSVLAVVAHPDDETIGIGGALARFASLGWSVGSCILAGRADARYRRPSDETLISDMLSAHNTLGIRAPVLGDFPNIKLNTVPHLHLVQFIENAIESVQADLILTHHPADLNDDHGQVARAALAASRLWLRRPGSLPPLRGLYFFETLSSTDWSFPSNVLPFSPTMFVDITGFLDCKLDAAECYRDVMRSHPHSRSRDSLRALARLRGAQAGVEAAEALQCVFSRL